MTGPICPRCILVDANTVRLIPMPAECPCVWSCVCCGGEFDYPPRTPEEQQEPSFGEWAEMTARVEEALYWRRRGLVPTPDGRLQQGRDRFWEGDDLEAQRRRQR